MTDGRILDAVARYYGERLRTFGPTARGVDWNSEPSQALRFEQLLKVCPATGPVTINDYGCGYGALVDYLEASGLDVRRYRGFDIAPEMRAALRARAAARFPIDVVGEAAALEPADVTVASGIFNVRLETPVDEWTRYVLDTLEHINAVSERGFAANFLSSYADAGRMRADLHYADPLALFDHCKRHFSRDVALLHDYGLYEFTIMVRK